MDLIIISDDVKLQEDDTIKYLALIDSFSNKKLDLIEKDNLIFIIIKLSNYGSVFIGNKVKKDSSCSILKKIDPLIILIKIIHYSTLINKKNEADGYKAMTIEDIISSYKDILMNENLTLYERNNNSQNLLFNYIIKNNKEMKLDSICNTIEENDTILFKLDITKVLTFLENKILENQETNKNDENFIRDSTTTLLNYLPYVYHDKFLSKMNVLKQSIEDTNSINNRDSSPYKPKQVKHDYKKNKKQEKEKEIVKDPMNKTLNGFFTKKK